MPTLEPAPPHPSESTILAYVGEASEDCANRAEVHAHVDGCDECHALVAALAHTIPAPPSPSSSQSAHRIPTFPQVGTLLGGRFRLDAVLGNGAMGIVYHAHDEVLGVPVAVKVVAPNRCFDRVALDSLRREASIGRRLNHRNIRRVFDLETTGDFTFLAMESIDGESLEDRLERGPFSPEDARSVVAQLAEAIEAAHVANVVHRDLKPGNVVIERDTGRVVVMDFGLARSVDAANSRGSGVLIGTPAYWSPEQSRGEPATKASDIYSFGLIAHHVLTGRPFSLSGSVSIPSRHRRALERCLEQRPEHRYPSVTAACEALLDRMPSRRIPRWVFPAAAAAVIGCVTMGAAFARTASPKHATAVAPIATAAPTATETASTETATPIATAAPAKAASAAPAQPAPKTTTPAKRKATRAPAVAPAPSSDAIDRESPYAAR